MGSLEGGGKFKAVGRYDSIIMVGGGNQGGGIVGPGFRLCSGE
jgi:hypothetical protein